MHTLERSTVGMHASRIMAMSLMWIALTACAAASPTAPQAVNHAPQDDPITTHYRAQPDAVPAWVATLPWSKAVSIADFPGGDDDERFARANQIVESRGGGVIYFPPGVYTFKNDIRLGKGVSLRGAPPTEVHDAKDERYTLRTRFEFPQYHPSFEGEGTPIDTAFKRILVNAASNRVAIVHIHINRGHILFPEAANHQVGTHRAVFGCILTNTAAADPQVPDPRYHHQPHQRWTARHTAAISVYSQQHAFVANNRIPESGDDNFTVPNYQLVKPRGNSQQFRLGQHPYEVVTIEDGVVFDYDNRPGITVNGYAIAGGTPQTHPWGFRKGAIIRDNYIYCTGRSAINFTGDGVICSFNVIRFPAGVWRPTCTGRATSDGSSTNDNRALTMRGYRWTAEGNDYIVHHNIAYDRRTPINDAEGIMHETFGNSVLIDSRIIRNRGNRYLCIWSTDVDGLLIEGNHVTDDGDPPIHVLGRQRQIRNVIIRDNTVDLGAIQVSAEPGNWHNIRIERNRFAGEGPGRIRVSDPSWVGEGNVNFEVQVIQPRR